MPKQTKDVTVEKVEKEKKPVVKKQVIKEKVVEKVEEPDIVKEKPKKEKVEKPKKEKIVEKVEAPVEVDEVQPEKKERKPRRVVTREAVSENLDKIIESAGNLEGKTARSVLKELKILKNDLGKVMKKRGTGEKKRGVTNSGFFKEVKITDDLAKFMSCSSDELKSRVDVTRYICKYVKDKNLQDQENKKIIVPDEPLRKLLKHDIKTDGALTFPSVQKLIQKHFVKV